MNITARTMAETKYHFLHKITKDTVRFSREVHDNAALELIAHFLARTGKYSREEKIPRRIERRGKHPDGRFGLCKYIIQHDNGLITYRPPLPIPKVIGRLPIECDSKETEKIHRSFATDCRKYQPALLESAVSKNILSGSYKKGVPFAPCSSIGYYMWRIC